MKYKSIIIVLVVLTLTSIGLDVYRNHSFDKTIEELNEPNELFDYLLKTTDPYIARRIIIKLGDSYSSDVDRMLRELAYLGVDPEESRVNELIENPVVKVSLARVLISRGIHNEDVKKYLMYHAANQNSIVRGDVAYTLRYIATMNSVQSLSKLAEDEDIVVFSQSMRSLIYLYDKGYEQKEIAEIYRELKLKITDKRKLADLLDYETIFTHKKRKRGQIEPPPV